MTGVVEKYFFRSLKGKLLQGGKFGEKFAKFIDVISQAVPALSFALRKGKFTVVNFHHGGARTGRGDDGVNRFTFEYFEKMASVGQTFFPESGVKGRLSAAGLIFRAYHRKTCVFKQVRHVKTGIRHAEIDQTWNKERNPLHDFLLYHRVQAPFQLRSRCL